MTFIRQDGRSPFELRACDCELSTLSRADGSARLKHGDTDVVVAVFGPMMPSKSRLENVHHATLSVIVKSATGHAGAEEKEFELFIRQTFAEVILATLHPRTNIRIVIQVIKDDGSLFSTMMNCTTLALMDAGIDIKAPVLSAVCAISADGEILLDPVKSECIGEGAAMVSLATTAGDVDQKLLAIKTSGLLTDQNFDRCVIAVRRAVATVESFIRLALQQKFSKNA